MKNIIFAKKHSKAGKKHFTATNAKFVSDYQNARTIVDAAASHATDSADPARDTGQIKSIPQKQSGLRKRRPLFIFNPRKRTYGIAR